jgi:hypothetical protein
MAIVKNLLAEHEDRVAAITVIGVEVQALVLDEESDELVSNEDPDADKLVYAKAFQAWADGKIGGTADEIFDAIEEALEVE